MQAPPLERVGVIVVRVWLENPPDGFRARVHKTLDVVGQEAEVTTASNPDEVCEDVCKWLSAFIDGTRESRR